MGASNGSGYVGDTVRLDLDLDVIEVSPYDGGGSGFMTIEGRLFRVRPNYTKDNEPFVNMTLYHAASRKYIDVTQWNTSKADIAQFIGTDVRINVQELRPGRVTADGKEYGVEVGRELPRVTFVGSIIR